MVSLDELSARQIAAGVAAGDFSAVEVAKAALSALDAREPQLHAFPCSRYQSNRSISSADRFTLVASR